MANTLSFVHKNCMTYLKGKDSGVLSSFLKATEERKYLEKACEVFYPLKLTCHLIGYPRYKINGRDIYGILEQHEMYFRLKGKYVKIIIR